MAIQDLTRIGEWAKRQQRRSAAVALLVEIAADDPEFMPEIVKILSGTDAPRVQKNITSPQPIEQKKLFQLPPNAPKFEVVKEYFKARENQWATTKDIGDATGIIQNTLGQLLYKGRKDAFERRANPDGSRNTQFRMK